MGQSCQKFMTTFRRASRVSFVREVDDTAADASLSRREALGCAFEVEAGTQVELAAFVDEVCGDRRRVFLTREEDFDQRRERRSPDLELLERSRRSSIARTLTVTGDW
jgi:hypothetical protein